MHDPVLFWTAFHVMIACLLACDFFIFQRSGALSVKKAWGLSGFWILLALIFNGLIYHTHGKEPALQFFTAYVVEKSLSIDNLFVFLLLFSTFKLTSAQQRKVLFWGVIGAIVFRIVFILLGIQLLRTLHWMIYLLGAFLCATGIKLLLQPRKDPDVKRNLFVRLFSFLPMAKQKDHSRFFVREEGRMKMTVLFLALLMIESTDILFALDSIPAVLAITTDPFIAYTSNIFAICPLLEKFTYLNWGLSAILVFVGVKMLISGVYAVPLTISLLVIVGILAVTAFISWRVPKKN